jgi:hypothetical protein
LASLRSELDVVRPLDLDLVRSRIERDHARRVRAATRLASTRRGGGSCRTARRERVVVHEDPRLDAGREQLEEFGWALRLDTTERRRLSDYINVTWENVSPREVDSRHRTRSRIDREFDGLSEQRDRQERGLRIQGGGGHDYG